MRLAEAAFRPVAQDDLEQAEEEAYYAFLVAEDGAVRAEAAYRRAVCAFLRADERFREGLAAAAAATVPAPALPMSGAQLGRLLAARMRAAARADAKRLAWTEAANRAQNGASGLTNDRLARSSLELNPILSA